MSWVSAGCWHPIHSLWRQYYRHPGYLGMSPARYGFGGGWWHWLLPLSMRAMQQGARRLMILLTHHHHDHSQGFFIAPATFIPTIQKRRSGVRVELGVGPERLSGADGSAVSSGGFPARLPGASLSKIFLGRETTSFSFIRLVVGHCSYRWTSLRRSNGGMASSGLRQTIAKS